MEEKADNREEWASVLKGVKVRRGPYDQNVSE
jgi:hypothetical protein